MILARSLEESSQSAPHIFTPVSLISRVQLPLSYLDTGSNSFNSSNRLFSARIRAFERHADKENNSAETHVLIARLERDGSLFAVEEVQRGIFSLCKLGSWVKEDDVGCHKEETVLKPRMSALKKQATIANLAEWWKSAAIQGVTSNDVKDNSSSNPRRSVNYEPQSLHARTELSQKVPQPPPSKIQNRRADEEMASQAPHDVQETILQPFEPNEFYSNIIKQYLDTLYVSKTSLAYFAKGPLSRARAAFTNENGDAQLCDLANFLRQCLLTKSMDRKYRDKIPELINKVALEDAASEIEGHTAMKKRKPKKLKPSSHGLFPGEEDYAKKWWHSPELFEVGIISPERRDSVIKRRTAGLRTRETHMQLILAMEVMALEVSADSINSKNDKVHTEAQLSQSHDSQNVKKRNEKMTKELNVFMDLLVDRLCIWQSLQQDEHHDAFIKQKKEDSGLSQYPLEKASNDALKAFCIEVIIPFYMSRLPKLASSINRKLGGPSAPSPNKRTSRPQLISGKPGEPTSRPKSQKGDRKPLHRVTSETINRTTKRAALAPPLVRSATDSILLPPPIKRESSEVPSLSSLPVHRSPSISAARPSTSLSRLPTQNTSLPRPSLASASMKRFSQREVDLDAMSTANAAKLRRKADIERKLHEAISALKKPRREVVGREVVEEAERRVAAKGKGAGSRSGGAGGARMGLQSVQVTATPKKGRRSREVVMVTPRRVSKSGGLVSQVEMAGYGEDGEEMDLPSSSFVPSTAVKRSGEPTILDTGQRIPESARALMERRMNEGVAETPSRGPAKRVSFFTSSSITAEKPSLASGDAVEELFQTPRKPRTVRSETVFASPVAARRSTAAGANGATPGSAELGADKSLYDALGWNDEL
ncbi:hypothetical protein EV356DRAFT_518518 [Viridothelium virens]|uniref:DNA replication regulator Sld3 C-terminal domain-containing protein n=1 Tax=Viridothelium virens TaxID=1048519 RepID=A0A6A6H0A3_VIRVR|nr:hypothetical protein EV356DRAFT_518518 [Viridothelium virens]